MNRTGRLNRVMMAFVCLLFMWPLALALVNYYFVRIFSGNVLCALYYVCLIMTYIGYGGLKIELRRDIRLMLIFLFIYGIVCYLSGEYVLLYNFIFALPIYLFSTKFLEISDQVLKRMFLWITCITMTITMIMTAKTLVQYPGAARVLASNSFAQYGHELYRKMGTGGFDFIYSLVVLVPVALTAVIKAQKNYKLIAIAITVGMIATILLSGYTTAILLLILAITLFLCAVNRGTRCITVILLPIGLWVFLNFRTEIADQIYGISEMFSSKAVTDHLIELADIIAQKSDVEELDRMAHYVKSIDAFLANPIIGAYVSIGGTAVSGHSTLLDLLGGGGLLCFIPYMGFTVSWHMRIARLLLDRWTRIGWNVTSIIYVALQLVNPIFANYLIIFAYMSMAVAVLRVCDGKRYLLS